MKVLFCDPLNTQNNFYIFAKFLRQRGIDASIAIDSSFRIPKEHLPEWHDSNSESLDWIHRLEFPLVMPYRYPFKYLKRWRNLLEIVRKQDIIVCSGYAPIWIHWANKPFIFFSYGSDLDQEAVQGWSGMPRNNFTLWQRFLHIVIQKQMVWALRKASSTVLSPYQINTANRLGLKNLHFLPHMIDTNLFKIMDKEQRIKAKDEMRNKLNCDLILFHPPRQVWLNRSVADCKGNDKVFKAFAEFVAIYEKRAKLIVVEKGWDVEASKKLVKELGIEEYVEWIKPVPRTEMYQYYNIADIVLDQFVVGVLTLVSVEAMSCGTPALSYVSKAPEGMFYKDMPPIINVNSVASILAGICSLADNAYFRESIGNQGRKWVEDNCQPDIAIPYFIKLISEALKNQS